MQIARQRKQPIRMEMSPLIDCIFQLLIFFMLSSTFLTPSIDLTLPAATSDKPPENQILMITIDKKGDIYVNSERAALNSLNTKLRDLLAKSKNKSITLRGDKDMKYEHFVKVLEVARKSGAVHVNIAHEARPAD